MGLAVNELGGGLLLGPLFFFPDFLRWCHSSLMTGMIRDRNSSMSNSRALAKQSSAIGL